MAECTFLCIADVVRDWLAPRIADLGFSDANVFAGIYRSHKKTPFKSLFIEEIFTPRPTRCWFATRVRLTLRGDKEADSDTRECLRQIMACSFRKPCQPDDPGDGIHRIINFNGSPVRLAPIDGHPIYTADLDVHWCAQV